jgi:hypothetical protein
MRSTPATTASNTPVPVTKMQQAATLIDSGANAIQAIAPIAQGVIDIWRIKQQSQADVAQIEAKSRAVCDALHAETSRLMVMKDTITTRGQAATELMRVVMQDLHRLDPVAQKGVVDTLTQMIATVVVDKGAPAVDKP